MGAVNGASVASGNVHTTSSPSPPPPNLTVPNASSALLNNCSIYRELVIHGNITMLDVPYNCRPIRYSGPVKFLIALVLGCIIVGTAIGNLLVMAAVGMVKKLQTPNNFLIVSLAGSDFLVAVLVLPWALVTQLEGMWIFDSATCDMFMIFDMTLCTSSILNLCGISIDRYLVITRPFQYAVKRTPCRMLFMIAFIWVFSACVTVPPFIGWKKPFVQGMCSYSDDLGYQIYATFGAFYLPLIVMLVLYGRIFKMAHRMAMADARQKMTSHDCSSLVGLSHSTGSLVGVGTGNGNGGPDNVTGLGRSSTAIDTATMDSESESLIIRLVRFKSPITHIDDDPCPSRRGSNAKSPVPDLLSPTFGQHGSERSASLVPPRSKSESPEGFVVQMRRHTSHNTNSYLRRASKRKNVKSSSTETKAITTLGVIMGCFTLCWLPFFILQIAGPIMKLNHIDPYQQIPQVIFELFLWLGYLNSFLNPIIYAKFNRDFRTPFKEILTCRCRNINARLRSESYAEQYGLPLRAVKRRTPRHACINRRRSSDLVVSVNRSGRVSSYLSNGTQSSHA